MCEIWIEGDGCTLIKKNVLIMVSNVLITILPKNKNTNHKMDSFIHFSILIYLIKMKYSLLGKKHYSYQLCFWFFNGEWSNLNLLWAFQ